MLAGLHALLDHPQRPHARPHPDGARLHRLVRRHHEERRRALALLDRGLGHDERVGALGEEHPEPYVLSGLEHPRRVREGGAQGEGAGAGIHGAVDEVEPAVLRIGAVVRQRHGDTGGARPRLHLRPATPPHRQRLALAHAEVDVHRIERGHRGEERGLTLSDQGSHPDLGPAHAPIQRRFDRRVAELEPGAVGRGLVGADRGPRVLDGRPGGGERGPRVLEGGAVGLHGGLQRGHVGPDLVVLLPGDQPLLDERAIAPLLRPGILDLREVAVDIGLRLPHVGLALGERGLRLAELGGVAGDIGLRLAEGGLEGARIDDEEQVAGLDVGPVGRHLPLDEALDPGAHLDGLHRLRLAHVLAVDRDRALRHRHHRDRGRLGGRAHLRRPIAGHQP